MSRTFVTFGQSHVHSINGKIFDKDCVAVIECVDSKQGREKAFELFSSEFCFEYHDNEWDEKQQLKYFPRGYLKV